MLKVIPGALLALALVPSIASAGTTARVTNGDNDGPGSLRAALESGATKIRIMRSVDEIVVTEPLEYTGKRPLALLGSGQVIDGAGVVPNSASVFAVTRGANVTISNLTVDAGGGNGSGPYTRENPGGGKGIFVAVPEDRTGTVRLNLWSVTVMGTGNHGVHVSDCSLADACGGGGGGGGDGSPASVAVRAINVLIEDSGNGKQDADGLRVDERGDGNIRFFAYNSAFNDVGADGVELDEGNNGNVFVNVFDSTFDRNGEYCLIGDFVKGDPCDDDGEPDVDDAFDVDEAGPGSVIGYVRNLTVVNNFDEGLDFDEEGPGGFNLRIANVFAQNNEDEGIKVSEEDDGSNRVRLSDITADGDLEFEEEDHGILDIAIRNSFVGDDMKLAADDGDPTTIDGFYRERNTIVIDERDFEGDIVEL